MKLNKIAQFSFLFLFAIACQITFAQPINRIKIKKDQLQEFLEYGEGRIPIISAHRGGRNIEFYPENSIEVFQYTISQTPAMIEFDVNMSKDSVLLIMHDNSLDRTTTGTGKVRNRNWIYIKDLFLEDDFGNMTISKVPTFDKVLRWAKKKALLSVDVKRGVPFQKVVAQIEKRKMVDYCVVITYNLKDAQTVHALNPNLMISMSIRNQLELDKAIDGGIPAKNIVAFTGTRDLKPNLYDKLHELGIPVIVGTMGNLDKKAKANGDKLYREVIEAGGDIIATDRPIEAAKAIRPLIDMKSPRARSLKVKG